MIRFPLPRLALALAGLWLVVAPARAEDKVEVRVLAILASEHHDKVHPKLIRFAEAVREKDPKLTGFKLHHTFDESIPLGETMKFNLIGEEVVEVTANKPKDETGRITLTIKPPKLSGLTYDCVCGKYMAIATEHYVGKDKERLFIAVMAKPCTLKPCPPKR